MLATFDVLLIVLGSLILPQEEPKPAPPAPAAAPVARPEDVASPEAITSAAYATISGPAGAKRDWDRFRSLFVPDARLIPIQKTGSGSHRPRALTVEDYVNASGPVLEERGFFEREVARREEASAHMAHVWSTYESRHAAADEQPFARGINSFQLVNDGRRWWIVTILWDQESPDHPIPERYLPGAPK